MSLSVIHPVPTKSLSLIAQEWDAVAKARDGEIQSGRDISYLHVLVPEVVKLARLSQDSEVIDVGCGTGFLSAAIASQCQGVTGVDVSLRSVELARSHYAHLHNIRFFDCGIEEFANRIEVPRFSVAVANMVLQDTPDLERVVTAIASVLVPEGTLVLTLPHPWFWPIYWKYFNEEWFDYTKEICIEAPLRTSLDRVGAGTTTHFHRPLDRYSSSFTSCGFVVESITEPIPPPQIQSLYPSAWKYPRFIAARLRRLPRTSRQSENRSNIYSAVGAMTPLSALSETLSPVKHS